MAQHLANWSLVIIYFCCIVQAPTDDSEKKMKQMESQSLYCLMQRPQYYQKPYLMFSHSLSSCFAIGYMDNHFIVQYYPPTLGVELHSLLTNQPWKYYYKPDMKIPQMHNLSLFKKFKIEQYKQQIISKLKLCENCAGLRH